jgi:hypothetical protein
LKKKIKKEKSGKKWGGHPTIGLGVVKPPPMAPATPHGFWAFRGGGPLPRAWGRSRTSMDHIWLDETPQCIFNIVLLELRALSL